MDSAALVEKLLNTSRRLLSEALKSTAKSLGRLNEIENIKPQHELITRPKQEHGEHDFGCSNTDADKSNKAAADDLSNRESENADDEIG